MLNKVLYNLPTRLAVPVLNATVDVGVDSIVASTFIDVGDNFALTQQDGQVCSLVPAPIPSSVAPNSMIQIMVADASANCVLSAAFNAGLLNIELTADKFPQLATALNTSTWSLFVPALGFLYPAMPMAIHVSATSPPVLSSDPVQGASFDVSLVLNASVVEPNGTQVPVFTLGLNIQLTLVVTGAQRGNDAVVLVNATKAFLNFSVDETFVGPIDPSLLNVLANDLVPLALAFANRKLANGFVLPSYSGLYLKNPSVTYESAWLAVEADFGYNPQQFFEAYAEMKEAPMAH